MRPSPSRLWRRRGSDERSAVGRGYSGRTGFHTGFPREQGKQQGISENFAPVAALIGGFGSQSLNAFNGLHPNSPFIRKRGNIIATPLPFFAHTWHN